MSPTNEGPFVVSQPCPVCHGQGAINEQPCSTCHAAAVGESVIFSADADHSYGNNGARPLRVIMIVITPPATKSFSLGDDPGAEGGR